VSLHVLPKVRSRKLLDACRHMPCTLRLASFGGMQCAPQDTVVPCHIDGVGGKGTGTKVSDLYVAAGCFVCHNLLDPARDPRGMKLAQMYPAAWAHQIHRAHCETMAYWIQDGLIQIEGMEVIR
jgi:hypothetical protein